MPSLTPRVKPKSSALTIRRFIALGRGWRRLKTCRCRFRFYAEDFTCRRAVEKTALDAGETAFDKVEILPVFKIDAPALQDGIIETVFAQLEIRLRHDFRTQVGAPEAFQIVLHDAGNLADDGGIRRRIFGNEFNTFARPYVIKFIVREEVADAPAAQRIRINPLIR